jgi:hypothetical protein
MKTKLKWTFLVTVIFQMIPIMVWASGFTIVRTKMIFPFDQDAANGAISDGPRIRSFNLSGDGGILLAGSTDSSHSLFMKINTAGKKVWSKLIDQKWPVYSGFNAFDSSDGGYWGIGYAYSRDIREDRRKETNPLKRREIEDQTSYQYLLKMDSSGEPLKQSQLSTIQTHNITCGIEVDNGLVFIGWDHFTYDNPSAKSGENTIAVPWIEKTDKDGKMLWQKTLSQDGNEVLELRFDLQSQRNCKGLITSSGKIVWATSVQHTALARLVGNDAQPQTNSPVRPQFETVILMFDQAGNEIHRMISKDADNAFLFPSSDGFSLVEHFLPHVPDSVMKLPLFLAAGAISAINSTDGGVRLTRLDANLQVLKTSEYKIPAINAKLGDVFLQKNGKYFLAGCNTDGVQEFLYLNSINNKFEVSSIYPHKSMNQCAEFAWTENPLNNELLLFTSNTLDGHKLMTIKYVPQ